MKVLTKNYGLDNGERKYLTYLMDDNNNALECFDTKGEVERSNIEMDLLKNNNLSTDELDYMTLEEYYRQEIKTDEPLILVFYLDGGVFAEERIECINPTYLTDKTEIDKLNELTEKLEEMFQVGVE